MIKRSDKFIFFIFYVAGLVLFTATCAPSHPHVFIAQETKMIFDDKGLAGFEIYWELDEMFAIMISEDFDSDHNGTLDPKEVAVIREKAFGYIASHNYYINIKIDGKVFPVKDIKGFNAELKNGKLIYEFFIPCHVAAGGKNRKVVLSPYDPEYYSAIYFKNQRHLTMENPFGFMVKTRVERDKDTLIFYETVNPLAVFLEFGPK